MQTPTYFSDDEEAMKTGHSSDISSSTKNSMMQESETNSVMSKINIDLKFLDGGSERRRFRTIAKSYLFGHRKDQNRDLNVIHRQFYTSDASEPRNSSSYNTLNFSLGKKNSSTFVDQVAEQVVACCLSSTASGDETEDYPMNEHLSNTINQDLFTFDEPDGISEKQLISNTDWAKQRAEFLETRKVVILENLPPVTDVDSILNQVYGGPIEKIVKKTDKKNPSVIEEVEVFFVEHKDAEKFMRFASTNLFMINGVHPNCFWADPIVNKTAKDDFQKIKNYVYPKNEQVYSQHGSSSIRTGARRCLILKKHEMREVSMSNYEQRNPYLLYMSDLEPFDVSQLIRDFQNFGDIINITPVVSRKMCVSINFSNIRDAIDAKIAFETRGTPLNSKYHKDWALWYGKDIADKPAFSV
ncbi:hypothetical protein ACO0QE_002392 [Hanseniaspora vineae]